MWFNFKLQIKKATRDHHQFLPNFGIFDPCHALNAAACGLGVSYSYWRIFPSAGGFFVDLANQRHEAMIKAPWLYVVVSKPLRTMGANHWLFGPDGDREGHNFLGLCPRPLNRMAKRTSFFSSAEILTDLLCDGTKLGNFTRCPLQPFSPTDNSWSRRVP